MNTDPPYSLRNSIHFFFPFSQTTLLILTHAVNFLTSLNIFQTFYPPFNSWLLQLLATRTTLENIKYKIENIITHFPNFLYNSIHICQFSRSLLIQAQPLTTLYCSPNSFCLVLRIWQSMEISSRRKPSISIFKEQEKIKFILKDRILA